jgi:hypothetical protein
MIQSHEMPVEACPKCGSVERVRPKLIATHILINGGSWTNPHLAMPFEVLDEKAFHSSPFVIGDYFISALFCYRCETGFIPDSRLAELGIGPRTSR